MKKNEPRDINPHAWYYVNEGSVDVVSETPKSQHTTITRLTRKMLAAMLAELKPLPKR